MIAIGVTLFALASSASSAEAGTTDHRVEATDTGPRSLLEAFQRANSSEESLPNFKRRVPTDGLAMKDIFGDSDLKGLFDGKLMTDLLAEPFEMPWGNSTAETDENNTYSRGDWNGMYNNFQPSESQKEREAEGGGQNPADLVRITETFAKGLMDLGDEDYTMFYVPMAVQEGKPGPVFHYLRKKEVVKMIDWTLKRLDIARSQLVNHFASMDPLLFKLAGYFDDVNRVEKIMDDNMANFLENFASLSEHTRAMVNDRVENAESILPTKTDKAWIQTLAKDVSKFNETSFNEVDKVYAKNEKTTQRVQQEFNNIMDSYYRFQWGTEDQTAAWKRTYSTLIKGVMDRLDQKATFTTGDLANLLHKFRLTEQAKQLKWFKSFLTSFQGIQAQNSFLNIATGLMYKTFKKFEGKMTDNGEKWNDRITKFQAKEQDLVDLFKKSVTTFRTDINQKFQKRIRQMEEEMNSRVESGWGVEQAKLEMEVAKLAKKADHDANPDDVAQMFLDTDNAFRANVSGLVVGRRSIPSTAWMQREIQRWGELGPEFRKTMKNGVFQPALNKISDTIKTTRGTWTSKFKELMAGGISDVTSVKENISSELDFTGNQLLQEMMDAIRSEEDSAEREADVETRAKNINVPSVDQMWNTLRNVQSALLEFTDESAHLHEQVAAFNKTNIDLSSRKDGVQVGEQAAAVKKDWDEMASQSAASMMEKLKEISFRTPPEFKGWSQSLAEVSPSPDVVPEIRRLLEASAMVSQLPKMLNDASKNATTELSDSMNSSVHAAAQQFLSGTEHILSADPMPAQLRAAQEWVKRARFNLANTTINQEAEMTAQVDKMAAAYDKQQAKENKNQATVESAIDHANDGDVLVEQAFARKQTSAEHMLNELADKVHGWIDRLPDVKPLDARLTAQDVQLSPPRAVLPSLEDLGLARQPIAYIQSAVADAKHKADIAHEKAVSALLEQAEAAHVLTNADVLSDAGEILLADAEEDGRQASFPKPKRDPKIMDAEAALREILVAAGKALPDPAVLAEQTVHALQMPDASKTENAVGQLRRSGGVASVSNEIAKEEQKLDEAEGDLQREIHGVVEAQLSQEMQAPPITLPILAQLKANSGHVQDAMMKRMQKTFDGGKQEMDNIIGKMSQSSLTLHKAVQNQGARLQAKVDALKTRTEQIAQQLAAVDQRTAADAHDDDQLHQSMEAMLDALPQMGTNPSLIQAAPASAFQQVSQLHAADAARSASDKARDEHVSQLEAAVAQQAPVAAPAIAQAAVPVAAAGALSARAPVVGR